MSSNQLPKNVTASIDQAMQATSKGAFKPILKRKAEDPTIEESETSSPKLMKLDNSNDNSDEENVPFANESDEEEAAINANTLIAKNASSKYFNCVTGSPELNVSDNIENNLEKVALLPGVREAPTQYVGDFIDKYILTKREDNYISSADGFIKFNAEQYAAASINARVMSVVNITAGLSCDQYILFNKITSAVVSVTGSDRNFSMTVPEDNGVQNKTMLLLTDGRLNTSAITARVKFSTLQYVPGSNRSIVPVSTDPRLAADLRNCNMYSVCKVKLSRNYRAYDVNGNSVVINTTKHPSFNVLYAFANYGLAERGKMPGMTNAYDGRIFPTLTLHFAILEETETGH